MIKKSDMVHVLEKRALRTILNFPHSRPTKSASHLDCIKDRDLWPVPIFERAQCTCSVIFSQSDLLDLTMSPSRFFAQSK